jgi:N-acetylglucosamine-6-sulfatase
MKKIVLPLASVTLVMLLSLGLSGSMPTGAQTLTAKPNIVFILADDMRKDDLKYMPQTRSLLAKKGVSFENAFVSNALCCPSRATILRGQYAHNTGVWSNMSNTSEGGWRAYRNNGLEQDNMATRLDAAGYRTGLFGKYFNGYHQGNTHVPPGWDRWFATGSFRYFDYDANDQGTIRHFGTSHDDYITDVLSRETNAFISDRASLGTPFFAYVTPIAPHDPATPAPRDLHTYDGVKAPRLPSFNEQDVSDKPTWIRSRPILTTDDITVIDNRHEKRAESLQALDDLVAGVVTTLYNANAMSNTYIFFTSDNGWSVGEHRRPHGKANSYEEDIHMPLLVRGPDPAVGAVPKVRPGSTTDKLALNTDYLPTFTDLACPPLNPCDPQVTQKWSYVPDGRSLRPVLEGNATSWRSAILLEAHQGPWTYAAPTSSGIRTVGTYKQQKYIEYEGGAREFYNLGADPYELTNKYPDAKPAGLASRLQALKTCKAAACAAAEDGRRSLQKPWARTRCDGARKASIPRAFIQQSAWKEIPRSSLAGSCIDRP